MFKEFFEREEENNTTKYKVGYFYIAMLEAIENSIALATSSLIEMASAISGAVLAIGIIIGLLWLGIIKKIPLNLTRLVSGILLALTGIPLIIYGLDVPYPEFMHWLIPPLYHDFRKKKCKISVTNCHIHAQLSDDSFLVISS